MADRQGYTNEIIQATTKEDFKVELDGKDYSFGNGFAFRTDDEGLAREIQAKYGRDVVVDKIKMPDVHDRGHKYFFTNPGMPWHEYDELGKRRK